MSTISIIVILLKKRVLASSIKNISLFSPSQFKRFLFLYLSISFSIFSQENETTLKKQPTAEKIYLQLNSEVYASGQNIWFKAIVTNAENHIPSKLSGLLYVDLINAKEQIVSHKLVKLSQGTGRGFFKLKYNIRPGRYLIRAYTQWNRNFGDDFMFRSYVHVQSTAKPVNKDSIATWNVTEKEIDRHLLTGQLWAQEVEGNSAEEIKVYLDWGFGQDTVALKRIDIDSYTLEYEIPDKLDWINIIMDKGNTLSEPETIVLNNSYVNLQFFPESGELIAGFRNKIGFKAIGMDGMGKVVHGDIFDTMGKRITAFKSNPLGMGVFFLEADSTKTYYAKIDNLNAKDANVRHPLPKVAHKGSIISVADSTDKIRIRVSSNTLKDSVFIKASCRGLDYYMIEGFMRESHLVSELPLERLPEGIIVFTLMDSKKKPVAERLYFNKSGLSKLDLELSIDRAQYKKRTETKLDIQIVSKSVNIQKANMSVMVINKEQWHQGIGQNISSYFLLSSELRGEVENPGYYFMKENSKRYADLDALLLTQGWRNYKYPVSRQGDSIFWQQTGLNVKGKLLSTSSKKMPVDAVNLSLATFGKEIAIYAHHTDSIGGFNFLLDDAYGLPMRILLQANKLADVKTNYAIALEKPGKPKIKYQQLATFKNLDSVSQFVVETQQRRNKMDAVFDSLYGVTQLNEVVVEAYEITPERKAAHEKYGLPDVVIKGDVLREKEKKWSYGLYSVLLFNYGDQLEIERFSDGFMLAHIRGGRDEPTLLVVDGRLLLQHEYNIVPQLSPDIVERVELIKYAKFFKEKFLTVFPDADPLDSPSLGHIISIYTKGGVGIYGSGKSTRGILDTTIQIFSPVKEYYAPKYDKPLSANTQKVDLRSLIHWAPDIRTDHTGNASISFYNGDISGDYLIIVEVITRDGRIGYQEKMYSVLSPDP